MSDKYCHVSLLDGVKLSRAKHFRYQHQNLTHLQSWLQKEHVQAVVTESIFSMHGQLTNVPEIIRMIDPKETLLIVDDAHALGVLGENGAGVTEYFSLSQANVPCLVSPFGKAFAGMGAMISGSRHLIEMLLQSLAKPICYSTAPIPAIAETLRTVLKKVKTEIWRRGICKKI